MPKIKYYERVNDLNSIELDSKLAPFDIDKLRAKGITSKVASALFRSPIRLLKFLRWVCPTLRLGDFVLVTRADDVREVLTNTKVFTVPFGAEMRVVSGGGEFILGINDGAMYRAQKKTILKAFPPQEMAASINQISDREALRCLRSISAEINPIEDLIKPSALAVCEEYFGLIMGNKQRFYESSLAVSSLLFADVFGNATVRELAMSGAKYMLEVIDLSVYKSKTSTAAKKTALDKLVAAHLADPDNVSLEDVRGIMMGMILGFLPTTMLGTGNALEVIIAKEDARDAVLASIKTSDDSMLESVIAEAMRFNPIQIGPFRLCEQDYVIAEGTRRQTKVKKGSLVIPSTLSAMFDSQYVERPDEFLPDRDGQDSMIFGYGLHSCIGAPMARAFTTQIFKKLFSLPNLQCRKGKSGRMLRLGIFPESIAMTWDQVDKYGDQEQSLSTICVPIKNETKTAALQLALESLGNAACSSSEIRAGNQALVNALLLSDQLHFASGCISPAVYRAEKMIEPSHLLFELSGDQPETLLIEHFSDALEAHIGDEVRAACAFSTNDKFSSILLSHRIRKVAPLNKNLGLNFNGTPGHGVKRIKKEAELSKTIYDLVLSEPVSPAINSLERLETIREKVAVQHDFNWAFTPVRNRLSESKKGLLKYLFDYLRQPWSLIPVLTIVFFIFVNLQILGGAKIGFWVNLGQFGAAISMTVIGAVLIVGFIAGVILVYIRRLEKRDADYLILPEQANYDEVTSRENLLRNNHMFSVSRIKPSVIRSLLLRMVLWLIKLAAAYKNPPGILSVIGSIHFARWVRVPGTRQLVFFSNYGGSWESYLEDFITKASSGLSSIWSNTVGFPRTQYLSQSGAKLSEPFKYWARQQQMPTPFWYVAYPNLNTDEIRKNAKIREGFARINDVREADQWFSLFGSSYRPRAGLDKANIQSLVFGGMGKRLPHSKLLFVSFASPGEKQSIKALMRHISQKIDFGETIKTNDVWQIGFTYRGLQRLGLSDEGSENRIFPNVFCQGANSNARSRILGDLAASHSDHWQWGSGQNEVDFVLMCYSAEATQPTPSLMEVRMLIDRANAKIVFEQDCSIERNEKGVAIEPFGYADGISQPIIKGTSKSQHTNQLDHLVAPGEILCGYPDERDNISPSPVVNIGKDILNVLPEEPFQSRPDARKDFGFNGSYLVIRQLQQDVDAFERFCETKANELSDNDELAPVTPEWVGAKMLGRWKDGRPLVRFPSEHKLGKPENDFRYRKEDPQGLQCPLGAHIRRANPRDSLGDDDEVQMSLSNRHRILRVGRPYKQASGNEKGLMFMCLNSDIERQFEFVQQTWLGNSSFHGLMGETDSVSSGECPINKKFTIPSAQGSVTLTGLQAFVTTKGSAYFFMPGRQALSFLLNL